MTEIKFSLVLSMIACFIAVEAAALIVCLAIMVIDRGPLALLEGIALWAVAQPIILIIAFASMPIGALVRFVLGLTFNQHQPRSVAILSGAIIGLAGAALFGLSTHDSFSFYIVFIGLTVGLVAGWVWWRIEKPFLD